MTTKGQQTILKFFQAQEGVELEDRFPEPLAAKLADTSAAKLADTSAAGISGVKRNRQALAEDAAAKLAFSKQTRTSFETEFPQVVQPKKVGGLTPHYRIPSSVILLFIAFWIPIVIVCDSVLRFGSGEKVKYFPIFSLLGAIAMVTASGSVVVPDDTPLEEEERESDASVGGQRTEVVTMSIESLKQLFRAIGHEERIGRGSLEFMIFKSLLSTRIEGLVEVKDTLPSSTDLLKAEDSPIWQLFSELCRALLKNGKEEVDTVWGALTDEVSWYFAKISRGIDKKVTIQLSSCLTIQKAREGGQMECTHDTKECLEFLFTLVQGTSAAPDSYDDPARFQHTLNKLQLQSERAVEFTVESYNNIMTSQDSLAEAYHVIVLQFKNINKGLPTNTVEDCLQQNPKLIPDLLRRTFESLEE